MSIFNAAQVQWQPSQNSQAVSDKGPIAGIIFLDFSTITHWDLDLGQEQRKNYFPFCQSVFIDNSAGGDTVTVTFKGSGMKIVAKAGSQGWYNVVSPNPIQLAFDSNGGALCTVMITNAFVPGSVWLSA